MCTALAGCRSKEGWCSVTPAMNGFTPGASRKSCPVMTDLVPPINGPPDQILYNINFGPPRQYII